MAARVPRVNIDIVQGEDFHRRITWKSGTPPLPVDLTGCTARMHIRTDVESPDIVLALTTENGRLTLGGTAGTIDLDIDAATTSALSILSGVHDLEIVFGSGRVRRLCKGPVTLDREVTRG